MQTTEMASPYYRVRKLIQQSCNKYSIDLIHLYGFCHAMKLIPSLQTLGIPIVVSCTPECTQSMFYGNFPNNLYNKVAHFIVDSSIGKNLLCLNGVPESSISIIQNRNLHINPVSVERVANISKHLSLSDDVRKILFFMLYNEDNNQNIDFFLKVMQTAYKSYKNKDILCFFLNNSNEPDAAMEDMSLSIMKDRIPYDYTYRFSDKDITATFQLASHIIIPSSVCYKAYEDAITVLEMAKSLIVSDRIIPPERIYHRNTGWVYRDLSVADCAAALVEAISLSDDDTASMDLLRLKKNKELPSITDILNKTLLIYSNIWEYYQKQEVL